jgi:hypothetical protein
VHKAGRTLEQDACRRQAESWVPKCEPPAVYKHTATLRVGAVTSSPILLEVHFYKQAYIVPRAAIYIVLSHEASYLYLINNIMAGLCGPCVACGVSLST